jgi:hypothetical protein
VEAAPGEEAPLEDDAEQKAAPDQLARPASPGNA